MTTFEIAQRFIGLREIPGEKDNPFIQWCFSLCGLSPETHDEVPWCSAFVNGMAEIRGRVRSHSARARSWLRVGTPIALENMVPGEDIVILKRGPEPQPGPEVIEAPGHVGFFAGLDNRRILILGGNQGNEVKYQSFPAESFIGGRRLA